VRRRDARSGNTVLHVVAHTGHVRIAEFLTRFCGNQGSQTPRSPNGLNQNLNRKGLDINAMNNDKKTPLQIAAENGWQLFFYMLKFFFLIILLISVKLCSCA